MPVARSSFGHLLQDLCFDVGGSRWGVITSLDWRDLPMNERNFVETETSSYKVARCEFAAPYKALGANHEPQNNTNNDRCRDGDPDSDHAIFLR